MSVFRSMLGDGLRFGSQHALSIIAVILLVTLFEEKYEEEHNTMLLQRTKKSSFEYPLKRLQVTKGIDNPPQKCVRPVCQTRQPCA